MKILGTGLNGLVGSRVVELLSSKYSFENISRATGVDVTDFDSVRNALSASDSPLVIHAAAYTDVKTTEAEKALGEESEAYKINVVGTHNVARACKETGKRMLYVSTDLVLGGDDMPEGGYTEEATPNPLGWYAVTKYEGEKKVREEASSWVIMRIAYPYRASYDKPDFVRFFKKTLGEGKALNVLTDRLVSPTFIDDIAHAIDVLVEKEAQGIYHAVGSQIISMYDAVKLIAETFELDTSLVGTTTREEFLVGRAPEPFSSALNNAKIARLGVTMNTFQDGLLAIKQQGIE